MRGTVAEVVIDRGFGFIDGDDGRRYFFHRGALAGPDFGDLAPGTPVEFGVQPHAQGDKPGEHPRAVNLPLTDDAIPAIDNEALPVAKTGAAKRSTPGIRAVWSGDPAANAPRGTDTTRTSWLERLRSTRFREPTRRILGASQPLVHTLPALPALHSIGLPPGAAPPASPAGRFCKT